MIFTGLRSEWEEAQFDQEMSMNFELADAIREGIEKAFDADETISVDIPDQWIEELECSVGEAGWHSIQRQT